MSVIRKSVLCCALVLITGLVQAGSNRSEIHASPEDVQPLLPGMSAPSFQVRDPEGNPVTFDPDLMQKPLVLTFYRGGWCPYCNLHLSEMRHAETELNSLGFDIWFVSIDRPGKLSASLEQSGLAYSLFSDSGLEATRSFGLAFRVPDELVERYRGFGIDLEESSGETHHVLPVPATYIIGSDGVIRFQYANPNYKVRLSPEVLLAAARAYLENVDNRLEQRRQSKKAD